MTIENRNLADHARPGQARLGRTTTAPQTIASNQSVSQDKCFTVSRPWVPGPLPLVVLETSLTTFQPAVTTVLTTRERAENNTRAGERGFQQLPAES